MGLELLLSLCWHVVLGEACAWGPGLRSIIPSFTKFFVLSILQSRSGSLMAGCLSPRGAHPLCPDLSWLCLVQIPRIYPQFTAFPLDFCLVPWPVLLELVGGLV